MDVFDSYYKLNKLFLAAIGQWVYQKTNMKILFGFLAIASVSSATIPQVFMPCRKRFEILLFEYSAYWDHL